MTERTAFCIDICNNELIRTNILDPFALCVGFKEDQINFWSFYFQVFFFVRLQFLTDYS